LIAYLAGLALLAAAAALIWPAVRGSRETPAVRAGLGLFFAGAAGVLAGAAQMRWWPEAAAAAVALGLGLCLLWYRWRRRVPGPACVLCGDAVVIPAALCPLCAPPAPASEPGPGIDGRAVTADQLEELAGYLEEQRAGGEPDAALLQVAVRAALHMAGEVRSRRGYWRGTW
jgi:hypothetical protein